jgi:POLQ-like helicase
MSFTGGQQMKPESRSIHLLSITQAKAKMYEYAVPEEHHIPISHDPARLFTLSISILGDLAVQINTEGADPAIIQELQNNLSFSAKFFDSYFQARLDIEINPYLWLLGSASYYLCALPGSSFLLAKKLERRQFDLECGGLEQLLLWILLSEYNQVRLNINNPFERYIREIEQGYQQFFSTGTGETELFRATKELRSFVYSTGTSRQLLFADLIGAITRKKYENSTWFCLPRYSDLSIDLWRDILIKPTFSIKELWPAQHLLGQHDIFRGRSAVVQMPTSAGKTKATEFIIRSAFLSNRTSLAVIVAPFRALCHEIRESLLKSFRLEQIFTRELSDVQQIDFSVDRLLERKQVLIVTPEKLNYVLRHEPKLGERIGLIIYDEGHQFDNGTRGITYELLLTSLKEKLPENVQSVLISAVISNGDQIGRWLNGENSETVTGLNLTPTYRSLAFSSWLDRLGRLEFVNPQNPEESEFFVPRVIEQISLQLKGKETSERLFPERKKGQAGKTGKDIALYLGLKLADNGNVAIFCGKKDSVTNMCERVVEIYERQLPVPAPYQTSKNRIEVIKIVDLFEVNLGTHAPVTDCARLGIFAHHNNIPHGLRLAIEYAIKEEIVNFVICTSTLAQGVNLPLRYLIVTSTYQGEELIKVRDFQNLIGRSGRAGLHTEGSILFSDPQVYDTRKEDGDWRWDKVKELLSPSNTEACASTLFSIFLPLEVNDNDNRIWIDSAGLIELYPQGPQAVRDYINNFVAQFHYDDIVLEKLLSLVNWKLNIISSIESYLMAHYSDEHPDLEEQKVVELARGTLAYFLADEDQKKQIEELFTLLAQNIERNIPEPQKRMIFGKTLFGLHNSIQISNWVIANIKLLSSSKDELELLEILWPILAENIHNSVFIKNNQPDVIKRIAFEWIQGGSYFELFGIVLGAGVKIIARTQLREFKIDHIVEVCDNGFAYEGTLVVGAIADFLELSQPKDENNLLNNLQILQKRMKYGLASPMAITLYELGFSDRVVSMALSSVVDDLTPDRDTVLRSLRGRQEQFLEVLNRYPSYFSEVFKNLTV